MLKLGLRNWKAAVQVGKNLLKTPGTRRALPHGLHAPANLFIPGGLSLRWNNQLLQALDEFATGNRGEFRHGRLPQSDSD